MSRTIESTARYQFKDETDSNAWDATVEMLARILDVDNPIYSDSPSRNRGVLVARCDCATVHAANGRSTKRYGSKPIDMADSFKMWPTTLTSEGLCSHCGYEPVWSRE